MTTQNKRVVRDGGIDHTLRGQLQARLNEIADRIGSGLLYRKWVLDMMQSIVEGTGKISLVWKNPDGDPRLEIVEITGEIARLNMSEPGMDWRLPNPYELEFIMKHNPEIFAERVCYCSLLSSTEIICMCRDGSDIEEFCGQRRSKYAFIFVRSSK